MRSLLKKNSLLIGLLFILNFVFGQNQNSKSIIDLKKELQKTTIDTSKINILNEIAAAYKYTDAKEGLLYGKQALLLAKKKHWNKGLAQANETLGICYQTLSNYTIALNYLEKSLDINKQSANQSNVSNTLKNIALVYLAQQKYHEALTYFKEALKTNQSTNSTTTIIYTLNDIANTYFKLNDYKNAVNYYQQSLQINEEIKNNNGSAYCFSRIGEIYLKQKKYLEAVDYYTKSLEKFDKEQIDNINSALQQLSDTYLLLSKTDTKNKDKFFKFSSITLKKIVAKKDQYSQSIENLKTTLNTTTVDTTKINILNRIASNYYYIDPREGIRYGEKALKLAHKTNYLKGIAMANDHLGVCQWVLTDYEKALNHFYSSLSAYENLDDPNGISGAYNNLGLVSVEMKKYDMAFTYFNKAYRINQKTNNKVLMVYNLNNIALAYYAQKKYNMALEYYNQSKEINFSMKDMNGLGYSYSKIGKIYSDQENYIKSLEYLKKALESFDEGQNYNLGNTYLEIGTTYYKMAFKNPKNKKTLLESSFQNLNKSQQLFSKTGLSERLNICFTELYKTTKEQGNFKLALEYLEKHNTLQDSLFTNENKNKLANLQSKREIELRDKQIEIQKLKIDSDSRKVYILVITTISVVIFLILFFYLYINKRVTNNLLQDKNKEISNINKQKDKFFSIIAHDLRGPFAGFLGLTEILAENINDMDKEDIQFAATNMRNSSYTLSALLDNLLEWSRMEQGLLPFAPKKYNLQKITADCTLTLQDTITKKNIRIETTINDSIAIYADHHIIQSVIRNILSNAVKFTSKGGTIKIKGTEDANNTLFSITDSGIGMSTKMIEDLFKLDVKTNRKGTEDEASSGLGLILCKEFIEKHGGSIWVKSEVNKGSTFYFNIPRVNG